MGVLLALKETSDSRLLIVPVWALHIASLAQMKLKLDRAGVYYRIKALRGGAAAVTRRDYPDDDFLFWPGDDPVSWPDWMQFCQLVGRTIPVPRALSPKEAVEERAHLRMQTLRDTVMMLLYE